MRRLLPILAVVFLACSAAVVRAHPLGLTATNVTVDGTTLLVDTRFASPQLEHLLGLDPRQVTRTALAAGTSELLSWYQVNLSFQTPEGHCVWQTGQMSSPGEREVLGSFVKIESRYECPAPPVRLSVRNTLFFDVEDVQENVVRILLGEESWTVTLRPDVPETIVMLDNSFQTVMPAFLLLGIEHVLTGADHLLFLVGMVLVVRGVRQAVPVVTAFTVAHSITLALAVTGAVQVSPHIVEPAIALTIIYIGIENVRRQNANRRWLLAFGFGLIHGLGFAGALLETGLTGSQLAWALLAFNGGVEIGQLFFLLTIAPALILFRRSDWHMPAVRFSSAAIGLFGLVWLAERILV